MSAPKVVFETKTIEIPRVELQDPSLLAQIALVVASLATAVFAASCFISLVYEPMPEVSILSAMVSVTAWIIYAISICTLHNHNKKQGQVLQSKVQLLIGECKAWEKIRDALEKQLEEKEDVHKAELAREKDSLTSSFQELQRRHQERHQEEVQKTKTASLAEWTKEKEGLTSRLQELQRKYQEELQKTKAASQADSSQIGVVQRQSAGLAAEKRSLETKVSEAKERETALQDELRRTNERIDQFQKVIADLEERNRQQEPKEQTSGAAPADKVGKETEEKKGSVDKKDSKEALPVLVEDKAVGVKRDVKPSATIPAEIQSAPFMSARVDVQPPANPIEPVDTLTWREAQGAMTVLSLGQIEAQAVGVKRDVKPSATIPAEIQSAPFMSARVDVQPPANPIEPVDTLTWREAQGAMTVLSLGESLGALFPQTAEVKDALLDLERQKQALEAAVGEPVGVLPGTQEMIDAIPQQLAALQTKNSLNLHS